MLPWLVSWRYKQGYSDKKSGICSCRRIMERRKSRGMFRHAFLMQFLPQIMRSDGIDKTQSFQMGENNLYLEIKYIKKEGRDGHNGTGLSVTLHSIQSEKRFSAWRLRKRTKQQIKKKQNKAPLWFEAVGWKQAFCQRKKDFRLWSLRCKIPLAVFRSLMQQPGNSCVSLCYSPTGAKAF